MPDLTIHHMIGARSERVMWLVEELGVPYKVVLHVPNTKGGKLTSTLTDHVKGGKAPSVFLDGKLLKESGFIVNLLSSTFPSPNIEATPSQDSIYWSHFAEGRIMVHCAPALINMVSLRGVSKRMTDEEKKGAAAFSGYLGKVWGYEAGKSLAEADEFLQTHEWFSGGDKPGIGDFMMVFPLTWFTSGKNPVGAKLAPATVAWLGRIKARPAYQKMLKRIADESKVQLAKPKL